MIIQVLIATLVGGVVMLKVFWKRIVAFLRRLFRKNSPDS
jgi:hypothetical protein